MSAFAVLAFAWLATSPMGATPPAAGAPRFVQLASLEGLPADSLEREAFASAFHDVFAESQLEVERRDAEGAWRREPPFSNRFRLLEGDPADDVWTLQVVVGVPAPAPLPHRKGAPARANVARRRSRGFALAVTAVPPDLPRDAARPQPERVGFAFAAAGPAGVDRPFESGGYRLDWNAAGRAAGLLTLERLHHLSEDLREDERFVVAPVIRTSVVNPSEGSSR